VRIYLDECADSNLLANFLQQAGHVVQTPRAANKIRVDDSEHLEYAAQNQYVLLTFNPKDFLNLHQQWQQQNRSHSGILFVYRDNDVTRDMRYVDIVRAINRLLTSGLPIANQVHILNQWR
jgi:predicted nuclease of predicted toxin-antitoxin system